MIAIFLNEFVCGDSTSIRRVKYRVTSSNCIKRKGMVSAPASRSIFLDRNAEKHIWERASPLWVKNIQVRERHAP
jgi:hypothetical protein